eukprot:TRINITY_DN16690_c1_g1_i1.p1 TRINITY_DN16690_c1_g1~~TRINITY_DN16690_c1_g1_i1.p1  ORF type:complete len:387 (-),score=125.77 TRINITY_DN16690_c1_g1_i1:48-1208(-)
MDNTFRIQKSDLVLPKRLLFGPGPSTVPKRILDSMGSPIIGHLDPKFLDVMNETQSLLRYLFQTKNKLTLPCSATGSGAMETLMSCLVEPQDVVLVAVNGYFGGRLAEMARRHQGVVHKIEKPWGEVFELQEIKEAILKFKPKIFFIVHAETSTGALQNLEGIGDFCHQHDVLFTVDAVTSLGGVPLYMDKWGIDAIYSGSQKCLNCSPGVSPISFNENALKKVVNRKTPVDCWYFDVSLIANYWNQDVQRSYHHTAPVSLNLGLRESLLIVSEEGLDKSWERHRENAELFWAGLEKMGLQLHVKRENRLPTLSTIKIPEGVDGKAITNYFLNKYDIEIGNGLGSLAGKVWRVGLMGSNSTKENVELLLNCFRQALSENGFKFANL